MNNSTLGIDEFIENSTEPTSNDENNLQITLSLLCLSLIFLLFYLFVLAIMLADKSHFSSSYYRIVEAMGVADLCILASVFLFELTYDGVLTRNEMVILYMRTVSDRFGDGLGYFPNLFLNVLIAGNRFVAIGLFQRYKHLFGHVRTLVYIVVCFIVSIFINR